MTPVSFCAILGRVSRSYPNLAPPPQAHLGGTILIVDDDRPNLDVMRSFLESDYRVLEALSGDEAQQFLDDPALDVILTDQRMPGMTGVELLQRARERRPDVAGVVVSAYADIPALMAAINQAGAFRFLKKPWQPAELLQAVAAACVHVGQQRAIASLAEQLATKNRQLQASLDDLRAAQSQLLDMERLVATGRMAAGIAHDLRNAMNGLMLLELELASRPVDADLADILQVGMASLRNLLDQLQALGVYSRQKRLSMALDRVDVAKAVRQALAFMHLDMDLRRRSLAVDTPEQPLPLIIGDRSKLVQVVVNLVRNATQATEPGQRIWVSVHGGETGLTVRVEDEGRGLPEGLSMVLFEPFVSTKGDDGLGLGLYMARIVAEHHRGTLTAVPRDPRGSVFDLYLPYLNSLSPVVMSA